MQPHTCTCIKSTIKTPTKKCNPNNNRAGRLNVEACERLDVRGKYRSRLKDGLAVTLLDGTEVQPEQVMSPDRPGRRVAVLGATACLEGALEECAGANCVVAEVGPSDTVRGRVVVVMSTRSAADGCVWMMQVRRWRRWRRPWGLGRRQGCTSCC